MSGKSSSDPTLRFSSILPGSKLTPIPKETQRDIHREDPTPRASKLSEFRASNAKRPKPKKEIPIRYESITQKSLLWDYKANPTPPDELIAFCTQNETTIAHIMAYKGNYQYFYDNIDKIDFTSRDRNGKTALDLAKDRGRKEVVTEIEKRLTQKLTTALTIYKKEEYKTLIDQGAPYSPEMVEKADMTEQEPLKIAISSHAMKRLNTNLSDLLSDMQKYGKAINQQERFEDVKKSARDIETSYNPLTEGLPHTNLSKHIGGIFRDAAKEAGVPLSARRTFTQWASDMAHNLGYKKKEREALKSNVGYKDIVASLKAQAIQTHSSTVTANTARESTKTIRSK